MILWDLQPVKRYCLFTERRLLSKAIGYLEEHKVRQEEEDG